MWVEVKRTINDESYYQAKMTENQFFALRHKLSYDTIHNELKVLDYSKQINKALNYDFGTVKKYLINGWSTEYILDLNNKIIETDYLPFTLHWSFPQAYYSVYTIALAFFKSVGFSEETHISVLKKLGKLIKQNKYPKTISFLTDGGKNNIRYINIQKVCEEPSIKLDIENMSSIDKHICQLLKTTREIDLDEKKNTMKEIKNKNGIKKSHFNNEDWEKVSDSLGCTSIYNFLYRKRIKANYKDIDVFLNESIDSKSLLESLLHIVDILNLINEYYIYKAIGKNDYKRIINSLNIQTFERNKIRLKIFESLNN